MFDTIIGVSLFLAVTAFPEFFIELVNNVGNNLHLEQLQLKIIWLLGYPAGFKPNKCLAHFIGHILLALINYWNTITSALNMVRHFIVFSVALAGWLGASIQVAALHDLLFLCSFWILLLYTVFTKVYSYILQMLKTQMRLFSGRKLNVIRGRTDSTTFNVTEMYLGVMIVSIILFLLPTLAIFYFYVFIGMIIPLLLLQLGLVLL